MSGQQAVQQSKAQENGSGGLTPEERGQVLLQRTKIRYQIELRARREAEAEERRAARGPRKSFADLALSRTELAALPDPVPLVHGWLVRDSLAWLSGPPESAKSFVALDISGCVATGQHWHGCTVTQGPVLYVVAEAVSGFAKRVPAWEAANGAQADGITFLPYAVQISDPGDMAELAALCTQLNPVLIVFDTQSRCATGVEENQSSAMSVLVDALDKLRVVTGACVLTVHHTPRTATNLRGSNSQEGAATTIIAVEKDGALVTVSAETARGGKQKDFAAVKPMRMALAPYAGSAALITSAETIGERARRVLEAMGQEEWSLSALIPQSEQSKSTVVRALRDLEKAGLISKTTGKRGPVYQAV